MSQFPKNLQYYKFCAYGFLKNLKFFEIIFLLYLKETGISYLQIGLLYSVRQITKNILEIPSGIIADVLGRKRALLLALFSYIVSFFLFYFAVSYYFFITAMVCFGIGEAFRSGTHKAMIIDYLHQNNLFERKSAYYGGTRSWSQFGSAISSLLAIPIVFISGGYKILFLAAAVPYLLDLLIISSYPNNLNGITQTEKKPVILKFKETFRDFISIFKEINILRALFSEASYIALYKGSKDYLQPILKLYALSLPFLLGFGMEKRTVIVLGIIYFFIFLMNSYTSRNAWKLEKYFNSLPAANNLAYIAGISAVGISGILYHLEYPVTAAIIFIMLYIIQNIRRPLMVSYISDIISNKIMASGLSAGSQLETAIIAVFAPILGLLIDFSGLGFGLLYSSLIFAVLFIFAKLPEQ